MLIVHGHQRAAYAAANRAATYLAAIALTLNVIFLGGPAARAETADLSPEYRPAVPVTILVGAERRDVLSSALTVEELLAAQAIDHAPSDEIVPSLDTPVLPNTVVRVVRVKIWTAKVVQPISAPLQRRADGMLLRGRMKTIAEGRPGRREIVYRLVQRNGERAQRSIIGSRVVRKALPRIVVVGTAEPRTLNEYAAEHLNDVLDLAGKALRMIATAYTGDCYGCIGITAFGLRPGHGVVAVDPRYIPLGTKLYVPGYGAAVAGDIGGAIKGRRIDLGFNSLAQAISFGRREVTVYVLR